MIVVNLDKARVVAVDMVRTERAPLFASLDVAQKRALVAGDADTLAVVEARLGALRDAPADQRLSEATTAEDLKAAVAAVVDAMRAAARS